MAESDVAPFDPLLALRVLVAHDVRFVIIGAFAGRLLGSPTVTRDLDLCYDRAGDNRRRLAAALNELNARLRGVSKTLRFRVDEKSLARGDHFTLTTDAGSLDVLGTPAGVDGYQELARTAERVNLDGMYVLVASIDDLIRMKRAAGRPKDLVEVEILGALRDELDRGADR